MTVLCLESRHTAAVGLIRKYLCSRGLGAGHFALTRFFCCTANDKYERAVLLFRNPRDALLAEFKRRKVGKVGELNEEFYLSPCKSSSCGKLAHSVEI